ncbi:phosphogluconate dehydrogenase (NAD(+)-dependent, decarboxylating) [Immundisolibacter sp.]|uniref:phosphogluconate dehydrogenase (NAD(+)-dependent, decarboxylating) n=1 Tax=Immundisolibacter sp. TaxID=1934948 RepID=UPI0026225016|nr:decarboxylating 6-phosphogluconate dehydrogenase [Immundisolibacter sp.]MDD3650468.1 decarboxylating 6-phosphogluconate dehydrogenase [Immundisolibacter sp.]
MQLGMIGLGRMGANMTRRLLRDGHQVVAYDIQPQAVAAVANDGAVPAGSPAELAAKLAPPRVFWLMLPAALVDSQIDQLLPLLQPGDTVVDGANSYYRDDPPRAQRLRQVGVDYVDVGVSGGVWGLERGYCLMIGGDAAAVQRLEPLFRSLVPGAAAASPTPGRPPGGSAEAGYLHCGPAGAGHFVKMIHNGIEYGLMAAYAEGFNILKHAGAEEKTGREDAETAPVGNPDTGRYDLPLADIAELWRRGSVVGSWLLDLLAGALAQDPRLTRFEGVVPDSGEGRWTALTAIEQGVPATVLSAALFDRFASRGEDRFANQILSALRAGFGGHAEH